jgi:hypothetical protein
VVKHHDPLPFPNVRYSMRTFRILAHSVALSALSYIVAAATEAARLLVEDLTPPVAKIDTLHGDIVPSIPTTGPMRTSRLLAVRSLLR